jgi:S1-C subfamily serine protease
MSGDVIMQVNNQRVRNISDFRKAVQSANEKKGLLLLINRHGRKEFLGIEP